MCNSAYICASVAPGADLELPAVEVQASPSWPVYDIKFPPPRSLWDNCVNAAKWMTGRTGSWGWAKYIKADTTDPLEAHFVLSTEGLGHIMVIASQDADFYLVAECNNPWGKCRKRTILKDAPFIRGLKK